MKHNYGDWEVVIGLEIHAELNTKSKLFSAAPNRFGDEPNTNITVIDTGMPGALPVINKEAIRKAVQFGCAVNGKVAHFSKFDRKSYFYPDSPRNYQITQYEEPIIIGGTVIAEVDDEEKSFQITRVHLEDDAGMLKHFPTFAGVDYNRAGVPLIEIVSDPCIHSPSEAVAYAMAVKAILQYIDASDCNMEEGSLRFDANISVRKKGEKKLRNKIEIKNMNSFNNMFLALEAEIKRQIQAYTQNRDVPFEDVIKQETFRWDPEKKTIILMRRKEIADDYRYFPEPDLVPIVLSNEYIEKIRAELPELPLQRERRYVAELALTPESSFLLTSDKPLADYFESALKICNNPRTLCNWLLVEFAGRFKESGKNLINSGISPEHVGQLVLMIDQNKITGKIAKAVADEMVKNPGKDPNLIVNENPDFKPLADTSEIEKIVDAVIMEHPDSITAFKGGKKNAFDFLVGQVMKRTRGKAPPQLVNELIKNKIN